jgi:hypothetical protein
MAVGGEGGGGGGGGCVWSDWSSEVLVEISFF